MNDGELLRDYLMTGSEPAFAELVGRHVDLVYSAARRQVRDGHLAEDVTQAVFIVLARKGGTIRNPGMLGAWLVKTARQVSCNAIRFERRRRRHEMEAAAMKTVQEESGAEAARIEGVLDEFLARLGERDRGAIVLRYLQDQSVNDVALALRISATAAEKRITRALSRLRDMLARRGIVTAGDALERGLSSQALHSAPAGLAMLASSSAVGKVAGGGAQLLAHSTARTIFWGKVQSLVFGLAASGVIVATVAVVAVNSMPGTHTSAAGAAVSSLSSPTSVPATEPAPAAEGGSSSIVHLPNESFTARGAAGDYLNELDPATLRTPASSPAGHIKSLLANIPVNGIYTDLGKIMKKRIFVAPIDKIRGKRIRVSGWIKTKNVRECAGLEMLAYSAGGELLTADEMVCVRPIHGTTDWRQYEMVQDIPQDATKIYVASVLFCSGEIWTDDFQVEVVGKDVALTDDQEWQIYSPTAQRYAAAVDTAVMHDGHAAVCFESSTAPYRSWAIYIHYALHPDPKFLGHRIRLTAWIKSSRVTGKCGFQITTFGAWDKKLTDEGERGHRPVSGTRDWQKYTTVADVPLETKSIYWGLTMNGRGTLWLDVDSVKVEVVDDAGKAGGVTAR
ncbi:MAG TPA: sigma-70 family RNA polymerase sigma factor [Tepidisphaeraceae bacterium]|jgi:RNA polymerase sigma factor (sigma-70 family)